MILQWGKAVSWRALALMGVACSSETTLDAVESSGAAVGPVVVEERFLQDPLPPVDVLVVVDSTASMEQEQRLLAEAFAALPERLEVAGVGWQLGVASMDMESEGRLLGEPWILTSGTEELMSRLAENLFVGLEGTGPEAGLAATLAVLDESGVAGLNAGFRRAGSTLHILIVSDSDDQSETWLGEDPVGAFLEALESHGGGVVSALVGESPTGCTGEHGDAASAERYLDVIDQTGGVHSSICAPSVEGFASLLEAQAPEQHTFPLAHQPMHEAYATVTVNGEVAEGWVLELEPPALVFVDPPVPGAEILVRYLVRT